MIGYLRGKIIDQNEGRVLLGISGVGYQVTIPQSAEYGVWQEGKEVEAFIHTHVREDALDLYGFASRVEKDLFLTLLTVNGIGPKGAMAILSNVPAAQLVDYVLRGDKDRLTKIPGIGKKTAERLVLELADPLRKKMESGALAKMPVSSASSKAANHPAGASFRDLSSFGEAKDALIGLGYREQDVQNLLHDLASEFEKKNGSTPRAEDLIRGALQRLSQ